jgi:hypothetical protein
MDIRKQRHLVVANILGLDPDLPVDQVRQTSSSSFEDLRMGPMDRLGPYIGPLTIV